MVIKHNTRVSGNTIVPSHPMPMLGQCNCGTGIKMNSAKSLLGVDQGLGAKTGLCPLACQLSCCCGVPPDTGPPFPAVAQYSNRRKMGRGAFVAML